MAVKFNGTSQYLERTANLPSQSAVTMMAFCEIGTEQVWGAIVSLGDTSGASSIMVGWASNSFSVHTHGAGGQAFDAEPGSDSPPAGTKLCVAITNNGTDVEGYCRWITVIPGEGVNNGFARSTVAGANENGAVNTIRAGNSAFDGTDLFDGSVWNVKVWDRVLTEAELLVESFYDRVVYPTSLNFHWRLRDVTELTDYSGNGRDATAVGSPTSQDSSWQPWKPGAMIITPAAYGAAPVPTYGAEIPHEALLHQGGVPNSALHDVRSWFSDPAAQVPARWFDDQLDDTVAAPGGTTRGIPFGNRGTAFNGGRTFVGPLN